MIELISVGFQILAFLYLIGSSPSTQESKPLEDRKKVVQVDSPIKPAEQPKLQEVIKVPIGQSSNEGINDKNEGNRHGVSDKGRRTHSGPQEALGPDEDISKKTSSPDPEMLEKVKADVFGAINQRDVAIREQHAELRRDLNQLRIELDKRENQLDIFAREQYTESKRDQENTLNQFKTELNQLRIEFDKRGEKLRKDAVIYSMVGALGAAAVFQTSRILWHYVERQQYKPLLFKYFQIWRADTASHLKQFNWAMRRRIINKVVKKPIEEQERIEIITSCVDTLLRTEKNSTEIDLVFTEQKIAEIARSVDGLCHEDIEGIFSAVKAQLLIKKELTGELIDAVVSDYRAKL